MLIGQIYETQASYTSRYSAPDRIHPALLRSQDDTHPLWGVSMHFPQIREDESDPRNGDHWEIVPHVLLEYYAATYDFDHDDMPVLVDTLLHHQQIPDPWDTLAWQQPALDALQKAVADLPDHLDPRMPYRERREVVLARTEAAKTHLLTVESAPIEDRQGALDWRRAVLEHTADEIRSRGGELDSRYLLGIDDVAPADPLEVLTSAPLDLRRVQAIRARDEWHARAGGQPPRTFGMNRLLPPA
ncbi:hypothetical protein [Acrocarpospora sp. B8E8]|uniref:hypothetical protein n=1 Tax=Acrocarpospora sp. B8E8 TaxID=3153572 RepID=UPI00325D30DE